MSDKGAPEGWEKWPTWSWEDMKPGLDSPPKDTPVTKQSIANYAKSVQNMNPIYFDDNAAKKEGFKGVVAPPTMVFTYAPMERGLIFNSRNRLSPEQSNPPRSTPFVGAEAFFQDIPVYAGDNITSITSIDKTWESRSGNRFVSFRVIGRNQKGEKVADYLYNVIWEYAKGSKGR